jgi:hypothetical protein
MLPKGANPPHEPFHLADDLAVAFQGDTQRTRLQLECLRAYIDLLRECA